MPGKGSQRLLNALVAMELLAKESNKYFHTHSGKELLSKDSPKYLGHIVMQEHHLIQSWSKLDQSGVITDIA